MCVGKWKITIFDNIIGHSYSVLSVNALNMNLILCCLLLAAAASLVEPMPEPRGQCEVRFSEIKLGENYDLFVELRRTCNRRTGAARPLKGFKIVILKDSPTAISYVLDLGLADLNFRDEDEYLLLSTKQYGSINPNFNHRLAHAVPSPEAFKMTEGVSHAFVLVKVENPDEDKKVRLFKMGDSFEYRRLDDIQQLGDLLSKYTIDLLAICQGRKCDKLSDSLKAFLQKIDLVQQKVVPKTSIAVSPSATLNNCQGTPYSFTDFHFGLPTPGYTNDCSGDAPILCDHILSGAEPYETQAELKKLDINSKSYLKLFKCSKDAAAQQPPLEKNPLRLYKRHRLPNQLLTLKSQIQRLELATPEKCKAFLPNEGKILGYPWISKWVSATAVDTTCRIICKLCSSFLELGFRPDFRYKDMLQTTEGYILKSTNPKANQQFLMDHAGKSIHQMAATFYEAVRLYPDNLEKVIMDYVIAEREFFAPTARNMHMVFAEGMQGVSFSSHEYFNPTLKAMGLNLGYHHYCRRSAAESTVSISETMHKIFLQELVRKNFKFSFLTDASTDVSNKGLLVCLLQTHDPDFNPRVFFYALLHLDEGEKAEKIFAKIEERIKADDAVVPGFSMYFKQNIVALVTDNASVMTSTVKSSLLLFFRRQISNAIISMGCMAHKLELCVKRAIDTVKDDSFEYFYTFEKDCNSFYKFFMSWGSKRFDHLENVAEEMDVGIVRLKRHLDVRWTASKYNVVAAIKQNLLPMQKTLLEIQQDKDYTKKARDQAEELNNVVTSKTFVLVLHEFLDFLPIFRRLSLDLQKSGGVLPGKFKLVTSVLADLNELKQGPGKELSSFLSSCSCAKRCTKGKCTLTDVEKAPRPSCTFPVTPYDDMGFKLSEKRVILYEAFQEQIRGYFDLETLAAFELFNPESLFDIQTEPIILSWEEFKLKSSKVCEFLKISGTECSNFGIDIYASLSDLVQAARINSTTTPEQLIKTLLISRSVSPHSKRLMETILVIPYGNADSERAFSFVNKIKPKQRFNLAPKNIEHLLRIRMNSPSNPYLYDSYFFVADYLLSHIRADDSSRNMEEDSCSAEPMLDSDQSWIF